ncbi:MAG TPA: hypothetical protein VM536_13580 [Chloroflexia bacterium]|nr:hypothetical protein [Chloroflexia bacterium]
MSRRLRLLAVPLLLLALVGETLAFAPWDRTGTTLPLGPAPLPLAAVNPFGAHVFLEREVDLFKKQKTTELLRNSGLGWIKQEFPWSEIEFRKNYFFDDKNGKVSWQKFDEIVDQAQANGLQLIARLDRAPDWARRPGPNNFGAPPQNLADFGDFVGTFVERYKGRVHVLQIWNEPNLLGEWDNRRPVNPAEYVSLLKVASEAARAADPDIIILSAPLATTNEMPELAGNMRETTYLEAMYKAGAASWFDIASANAFGYNSPPEEPPDPNTFNFRRVELLRAVMEQHGDAHKPIWITEYAWDAPDTNVVKPDRILWGKVTPEQQADYTVRGIRYAHANWAWAGVFVIWYFRQVGDFTPDQADYYFGLVTPDFVPRPVYITVQEAAKQARVAGAGPLGAWSAPVQAGAGWGLHLQRPPEGSTEPTLPLLVSTSPTATLTLAFRGTDLTVRLAAPAGPVTGAAPRLYVTVDGGTRGVSDSLPRDESGQPYVAGLQSGAAPDTSGGVHTAAPAAAPRQIQLVAGLGREGVPGVHQVQLRASAPGASIAGFEVVSERSYLAFAAVTGLLVLALGGVLIAGRRPRGLPPS